MTKQDVFMEVVGIVESMLPTEWVPNPVTRAKGLSTGNLAFNGITVMLTADTVEIYVDPDIVPYMPYTNEPWISDKWHGKKNPNEGWWQRFAEEFMQRLAKRLKGEIKND